MGLLEGKTALVTGASAGIGLGVAMRLAAEGAHVIITGRREAELEKAVGAIGDATAVVGDVSVAADVDRLYEQVRALGRGLDIVVANAGLNRPGPLDGFTEADHDLIFDVNVKGVFLTVQRALPLLTEGAAVVVLGSDASRGASPGMGAYAASKAAVASYAQTWARELADRGVRVNALLPGPVDTAMFDVVVGDTADEQRSAIGGALPVGRIGTPEDIANAVVFLVSPQSGFVHGAELVVDGGFLVA